MVLACGARVHMWLRFLRGDRGALWSLQIFGQSLELHPVVVLMALAFWFSIWGVVGAILSIPVTAVIRIVLSHINHPYAKVVIRLLEGEVHAVVFRIAAPAYRVAYTPPSQLQAVVVVFFGFLAVILLESEPSCAAPRHRLVVVYRPHRLARRGNRNRHRRGRAH